MEAGGKPVGKAAGEVKLDSHDSEATYKSTLSAVLEVQQQSLDDFKAMFPSLSSHAAETSPAALGLRPPGATQELAQPRQVLPNNVSPDTAPDATGPRPPFALGASACAEEDEMVKAWREAELPEDKEFEKVPQEARDSDAGASEALDSDGIAEQSLDKGEVSGFFLDGPGQLQVDNFCGVDSDDDSTTDATDAETTTRAPAVTVASSHKPTEGVSTAEPTLEEQAKALQEKRRAAAMAAGFTDEPAVKEPPEEEAAALHATRYAQTATQMLVAAGYQPPQPNAPPTPTPTMGTPPGVASAEGVLPGSVLGGQTFQATAAVGDPEPSAREVSPGKLPDKLGPIESTPHDPLSGTDVVVGEAEHENVGDVERAAVLRAADDVACCAIDGAYMAAPDEEAVEIAPRTRMGGAGPSAAMTARIAAAREREAPAVICETAGAADDDGDPIVTIDPPEAGRAASAADCVEAARIMDCLAAEEKARAEAENNGGRDETVTYEETEAFALDPDFDYENVQCTPRYWPYHREGPMPPGGRIR